MPLILAERLFYLFCDKTNKDSIEVEDFSIKFEIFFRYKFPELLKIVFDLYDFDDNGEIVSEDVTLLWNNLLSYETKDKMYILNKNYNLECLLN